MNLAADWSFLFPEVVVALAAILLFLLDAVFWPRRSSRSIGYVCLCASLIALCLELNEWNQEINIAPFGGMYARDAFSSFFHIFLLGATVLTVLLALQHFSDGYRGEFFPFLMVAILGAMVTVAATNLVLAFVGLELVTLTLCVLSAYCRGSGYVSESSAKFFVLGVLGSGFILYGGGLIYGAVGSLGLKELSLHLLAADGMDDPLLLAGAGFLLAGLCSKAAVVPFHAWAPDVRQGVIVPVACFFSIVPGAAVIAVLMRFFLYGFEHVADQWVPVMACLAIATIVGGYLLALNQRNLKRLLAYVFVAQVGFALIGTAAANTQGVVGAVFQICVSGMTAGGCYALLAMCSRANEDETEIGDYAGLAHQHPAIALIFVLLLLALAGLPPAAGFIGRFLLMGAVAQAGQPILVAVTAGVVLLSAFVACRFAVYIYMRPAPPNPLVVKITPEAMAVLLLTALCTLALGLFPDMFIGIIRSSVVAVM